MPAYDSQDRRSRGFRDISLSFEPHPVTKDITILRDTACIRTSVSNIVQTIRGERFFDEFFGSNIRSSFFEFVDFANAASISGSGGYLSKWDGDDVDLNWDGAIIASGNIDLHNQLISLLN